MLNHDYIKRLLMLIAGGLGFCLPALAEPDQHKNVDDFHYYRIDHVENIEANAPSTEGVSVIAERVNFGLTENQMQRLFDLTDGNVDFRHMFRSRRSLNEFLGSDAYRGKFSNAVPPPGGDEVDWEQEVQNGFDPETGDAWWITQLRVPEAWGLATGVGVTIADCDAGYYHNEDEIQDNTLVDRRYDLADLDAPMVVDDGNFTFHGTAVAAIMVALRNGESVNGIAYDAKLLPLQNYNYDAQDDLPKEEATAKCVLRAIEEGDVDIIVLENQTATGSSETFAGTREAVRLAVMSGIHVISAAGNYSRELGIELEDDTGSVIVGALNSFGAKASFSNFGERITVGAFGEKLRTLCYRQGVFCNFGGTSGATPQVAAIVALMLEVNPELSPRQIREILVSTRILSNDNLTVGGQVDAFAAVSMAQTVVPEPTNAKMVRQQVVNVLKGN